MSIFANIFATLKPKYRTDGSMTPEAYDNMRNRQIDALEKMYDLSTVAGIEAIPVPRKKAVSNGMLTSVTGQIDYYLQRKAGVYEAAGQVDLAIACFKKAVELMPFSATAYRLDDYLRYPHYLRKLRRFDNARSAEQQIRTVLGLGDNAFITPFSLERNEYIEMDILAGKTKCQAEASWEEYQIERELERVKLVDRQKYNWLWEHLPDQCPKSFGGYRKMKNGNTATFQKLCELARLHGIDLLHK